MIYSANKLSSSSFLSSISCKNSPLQYPDFQTPDMKHIYIRFGLFACLFLISQIAFSQSAEVVEPDNTNTPLQPPHGIRWTRAFGGINQEAANDVVALPDSGFIVVGSTTSTSPDFGNARDTSTNGFIARFDRDGHLVWKHVLGGGGFVTDDFRSVVMASPGIFYAAGIEGSAGWPQAWIVKFNINGDILWNKTYGGSRTDEARSILATEDGGCIFAGQTTSFDGDVTDFEPNPINSWHSANFWLVKLDANGTRQWDSCYFGPAHAYEVMDLKKTKDNKIIVGGAAIGHQATFTTSALLLLLNNDGTRVWEHIYHKPGLARRIYSLVVNDNNSFTFTGEGAPSTPTGIDTTYSGLHGEVDVWTANVDNSGSITWEKYFGGSATERGSRIISTSDNNYVVVATTGSNDGNVTSLHGTRFDGWLLKINPAGNLVWQKTIGGSGNEMFSSVAALADRSLMAVGYTTSNDGDISGYLGGSDVLLAKVGVSNFITGSVFIDLNNNGTKEVDEPWFKRGIIRASSSSQTHSGILIDGLYQVSVDTGNYVVKFYTVDSAFYDVIPASSSVSFSEYSQTQEMNFRLVPTIDINDLRLDIIPMSAARPGFNASFLVKYENKGIFEGASVTVRIKLGNQLTYLSSTASYSSIVGDTLVWVLPAPGILQTEDFVLTLRVKPPPNVNNGDTLRIYGEILPIATDIVPLDNIVTIKQPVTGSYDPNDKIEVHGNTLPYNFVEKEEYLTYVIRFQNTGTDTAFNVYVRDTLSNKFDWNTFEMIDASHPYELSVQDGHIMEWYFRNINLPDSNVNEPASHGFIAFRIKPQADILPGDTLENDAAIYFDFNLPVETNLMRSAILLNAPLPSTVLQFNADWKPNGHAQIKWVVVNEASVVHYEVLHSLNGIDFSSAGTVAATNAQGQHNYEFTHTQPSNENYYRLKTVGIDGSISYSKIIILKRNIEVITGIKIFPVPARGEVTMLISGQLKGNAVISIYTAEGKLVRRINLGDINQQDLRYTFNGHTLRKGIYIVHCAIGDKGYQGSIIIE